MNQHSTTAPAEPVVRFWTGDGDPIMWGWSISYDGDAGFDEHADHPDGRADLDTTYSATIDDDTLTIVRTDTHRWNEPGYVTAESWRATLGSAPIGLDMPKDVTRRLGFDLAIPGRIRGDVVEFAAHML